MGGGIMRLLEFYEMQEIVEEYKNSNYNSTVSKRVKQLRTRFFEEYKNIKKGLDNPYSMDSIAYLLGITPRHYKKLESTTYNKNNFNDDKLLILSKIFGVHMEDFYK